MTTKEIEELQVTAKKKLEAEYAEAKKNWEELGTVSKPEHYKFFIMEKHYSSDIHNIPHDEVKTIIDTYIEELDALPKHISVVESTDIEFYDSETVSEYRLQYRYQVFNENFKIDNRVKVDVKKLLEEKLKPKSYKRVTREIDCSLLKLFMDKVIKWTDVQKLVYSDCEL
jgi:hypothetical protein